MVEITSLQNELIKRIRSLKHRKYRRREGRFWVEGIRIVLEALELHWDIEALVWSRELLQSDQVREVIANAPVKKVAVSERIFRELSDRGSPQGLGALVRIPKRSLDDLTVGPETFLSVLEEPQDPGNIGTAMRTTECGGGSGVILLGNSADPYDPQAVWASTGALFAIPVVTNVSVPDFLTWKESVALRLVATSADAGRSFREVSYLRPLALMFGSEPKRLSKALLEAADEAVRIPLLGRASSLNLAAAVAVTVYQVQWDIERSEREV